MSWGEDNFEGEATRQVSRLFEQLDGLLYHEDSGSFKSFPVVPLPRSKRLSKKQIHANQKKNLAEKVLADRNSNQSFDETLNIELEQRLRFSDDSIKGDERGNPSDSDSGDEVIWKVLETEVAEESKESVNSNLTNSSNLNKSSQRVKVSSNKLATISESMPNKAMIRPSAELPSNTDAEYDDLDSDSESEEDEEDEEDDSSVIDWQLEGGSPTQPVATAADDVMSINLPGGIYAMGFAATPRHLTSSPLLLPTPTTPPGVPSLPTPVMKEECAYWSSRFLHLR